MIKSLKDKVRKRVISEYSGLLSKDTIKSEELKGAISWVVDDILRRDHISLSEEEKQKIISDILDEVTGLGPIENFLKDSYVTEIMINGPKKIYIERGGKTELTDVTFEDDQQLMYFVYKILSPTRRRVDESNPYTEVALKDGSRANIVIKPIALDGPSVTIRKFLKEIKTVDDLVKLGTLDKRISDFLVASIKAKINMIFSGATGAGKTTTLNVLSSYIPNDERIVTIEDTAELSLKQEHIVRLEAKQANIEGKGEISIRDLFKNSLRMRPDRIILGEIRGAEALDMLQAICSGHSGSLAVIHANSPQDVISRLETMILVSGIPLSLEAIHRQIAHTIHLVVQQEQLFDGSRKITHVTQVRGIKEGQIILEDIFLYEIEDIDPHGKVIGKWRSTGASPVFYDLFKKAGIELQKEIFNKD